MTWQPVSRPPSSGPVTGYAVYADGKKVTDVDSPTGDHALIDIGKLVGLNPRAVTVRTKSRDSQSSDSQPTPIPSEYLMWLAPFYSLSLSLSFIYLLCVFATPLTFQLERKLCILRYPNKFSTQIAAYLYIHSLLLVFTQTHT